MKKPIRVLSIDGGGTRGLFPATILRQMETATGRPVTELFDVIVGSATGGIITVALSAGMTIPDIMDIYLRQANYILPRSFWRRIWNPLNLFAPKYPSRNLKKLLAEKMGTETTLADARKRFGTDTIFLCGTLDMSPELQTGEVPAFKVVIYNSAMSNYENEKLIDLAMRTSAAPINLPLYQRYSESGTYANDPTLIALSFLMNRQKAEQDGVSYLEDNRLGLGLEPEDIRFLSLGCGTDGGSYTERKKIGKGNWGMIKWMSKLIHLVIETNMVASQYYMHQFLNEDQYMRLSAYYKAADAPAVLKNKKLAIDVTDPEQLNAIKAYAEQIFEREKERLFGFLGW
jgi:patatin-like phospholipase/acyl hydrolase